MSARKRFALVGLPEAQQGEHKSAAADNEENISPVLALSHGTQS